MSNYNLAERAFHKLSLKNNFIKKALFEIEKIFFLKKTKFIDEKKIFITGLPRSGTTILLNFLYNTNEFASLTYSNMPLLLSPNLSKIFSKKKITKKLRAHKDGIFYNSESPEAFDEVFFKTFSESEILMELKNYINLILISKNKKNYLSKNNLNYKRITLIQKVFPEAKFIIPVRDPIQQSYSLLNQHLNFINLQKKDNFTLWYMNTLSHNEFGLNHKPWHIPKFYNDKNDINYWLEQWILFYQTSFKNFLTNKNCKFIIYENFCNKETISNLSKFINIEIECSSKFTINKKILDFNTDKLLTKKCYSLYSELSENSL